MTFMREEDLSSRAASANDHLARVKSTFAGCENEEERFATTVREDQPTIRSRIGACSHVSVQAARPTSLGGGSAPVVLSRRACLGNLLASRVVVAEVPD